MSRPRRPVLFVNSRSGGGKAARAGVAEAGARPRHRRLVVRPDRTLAALVDEAVARGVDALGVAGGDGSLAVVATAASRTVFLSSAFPPAPATTSRSTSASIETI